MVTGNRRTRWRSRLFAPIDGASLAVFRMCFGGIMLYEMLAFLFSGDVYWHFVAPQFHFYYPGFSWVKPWPGWGMTVHFWVLAVLAALVVLVLSTFATQSNDLGVCNAFS